MGACILKEGHSSGLELRYQATLSGDGTATPVLTKVQVTYSGDNPTTEYDYTYDPAGNLTNVDTITAAGTATEVRDNPSWPAADQINNLNQILRNDVTPAGGSTTTYRYTYNADGTLATKTVGMTTWTYNWDPVGTQRLLSVEVDNVTQVAYTYDSLGRMLTRTPYSGGAAGTPTSFEWDGMTVVRETTPDGVYRYYAPQGELITFDYTPNGGATASYSAHGDAIGSIRAVTDSAGALVAHFEYDAWGSLLPTSDFGPLVGWSCLFVGSLGVRWDAATGLYYMRQRWYDPGLQRFVGRDPLGIGGGVDLYVYSANNPVAWVDPAGQSIWDWLGNTVQPYVDVRAAMQFYEDRARAASTNPNRNWFVNFVAGSLWTIPKVGINLSGFESAQAAGEAYGNPCSSFGHRAWETARLVLTVVSWALPLRSVSGPRGVLGRYFGGPASTLSRAAPGSGYGDLTLSEAEAIQRTVNRTGRGLSVIGSTVRAARGPLSDIDYLVPKAESGLWDAAELPGPAHIVPSDTPAAGWGPQIRFEPNAAPRIPNE